MTIINPNSISGITSFTAEADVMNFYKSNGTLGSLQLNGCNFNTTNGISTFNNLVVGGVLTYEDVKNVDSIGIITARAGINLTGGNITLGDSGSSGDDRIHIGAGNDIQLYHYSGINYIDLLSNTEFRGSGSTIKIKPKTSEEGIIIVPDGSVSLYYDNSIKFRTESAGAWVKSTLAIEEASGSEYYRLHTNGYGGLEIQNETTKVCEFTDASTLDFPDNNKIQLGTGSDLSIYHNGTNSIIDSNTGDLNIDSAANQRFNTTGNFIVNVNAGTEDGLKVITNGAVELYYDNSKKFETTTSGISVTGQVVATTNFKGADSVDLVLGTGSDFRILHDGTDNVLTSDGGQNIRLVNHLTGGNETMGKFIPNGAAELYHNGSKKLETASWGVDITGDCRASELKLEDGNYLSIGSGNDLRLRHDGTNSTIVNSTGSLKILGSEIKFMNAAGTQNGIIYTQSGSVQLYHNNNEMFYTSASGCHVGRPSAAAHLHFLDGGIARFGSGNDLEIKHNGSRSDIKNITGDLFITNTAGPTVLNANNIVMQSGDQGETIARFLDDGACELWYDNSKKIETTSTGITVTGKARINGGSNSRSIDVVTTHSSGGEVASFQNSVAGKYGGLLVSAGQNDRECRLESAFGASYMTFWTQDNATNGERMRIDPNGHIFFSGMTALSASSTNKGINIENFANYGRMNIHAKSGAGTALGISFYNNGANVGQVQYGTSSTSYNTSSDYRLKENAVLISDGITRLKTLKPYRFNFKVDPDKTVDGFFAHEVTAVPEAVSGEKDGDEMQMIDQAKIVPLLTAALQEEIAKREALEARVAALES